ncbi:hypothetical protein PENSUB_8010 [Penicillium subrubescens]|uniref:Uncharacterized protein n=1 Tax=Penicillium subrubescens TaxID=1316194 RepID=A0A1Q5TIT2_9EURO|nr:hypothetical protein PENSUB_8010 [Penicillium subrubescens]
MSDISNSSTPELRYSSTSTTSPPSTVSSRSPPLEASQPAWELPYRTTGSVKPQSSFLFIDYQADTSKNKKLRNEKQGFLLKNYHRRKKQASILRLKTPRTAPTQRFLADHSTSEQPTSDNADSTEEQDGWVDKGDSGQAALRSEMWSLKAYLSQGFVDPFGASAAVDANIEAHNAHMKGLKRLIQLMGGLDTLDHMTLSKIYQSDVKSAALYNSRPVFPISSRWRSEIIQDFRLFLARDELDTPKDLASLGITIFSSLWYTTLDRTMKTFLQVIRRLILYYEYVQRNPASVMPTDNDLFLVAEHQILSAGYTVTDPTDINEPLRLTLVVYLNLRVWHFQSFPFMEYVVESLRQSLNLPYSYLQTETPELLFWILVLGSLGSQGYKCHRWYLNRLILMTDRLGLRKWEEARALLGGYFYTDQISEKKAEEDLWNEVLLRETFPYIAPKLAR